MNGRGPLSRDKSISHSRGRANRPRPTSAPYREVFVAHEGQARYTIGSTHVEVQAGQIVIVPNGMPHKFVNSGEGWLRQTDIHLSKRVETEWLETLFHDGYKP